MSHFELYCLQTSERKWLAADSCTKRQVWDTKQHAVELKLIILTIIIQLFVCFVIMFWQSWSTSGGSNPDPVIPLMQTWFMCSLVTAALFSFDWQSKRMLMQVKCLLDEWNIVLDWLNKIYRMNTFEQLFSLNRNQAKRKKKLNPIYCV